MDYGHLKIRWFFLFFFLEFVIAPDGSISSEPLFDQTSQGRKVEKKKDIV